MLFTKQHGLKLNGCSIYFKST